MRSTHTSLTEPPRHVFHWVNTEYYVLTRVLGRRWAPRQGKVGRAGSPFTFKFRACPQNLGQALPKKGPSSSRTTTTCRARPPELQLPELLPFPTTCDQHQPNALPAALPRPPYLRLHRLSATNTSTHPTPHPQTDAAQEIARVIPLTSLDLLSCLVRSAPPSHPPLVP